MGATVMMLAVPWSASPARPVCHPPSGYRVVACRVGVHGTLDLSRSQWQARRGAQVSISERVFDLAANPDAAGAARWPLIDSLGQAMGSLHYDATTRRFGVATTTGREFAVSSVRVRGRGCAASFGQQRSFTLVQIHAPASSSHGTQAFLSLHALNRADPAGRTAASAFARQRGTGCGPSGRVIGRYRPLADPGLSTAAHARLSNGQLNSVDEYNAKPDFAHVVYLMSNTTSVSVGGIARGMIRTGTPIAKVDRIPGCDPNSDHTLTWRYIAIATKQPTRPLIYGWLPAPCPPDS